MNRALRVGKEDRSHRQLASSTFDEDGLLFHENVAMPTRKKAKDEVHQKPIQQCNVARTWQPVLLDKDTAYRCILSFERDRSSLETSSIGSFFLPAFDGSSGWIFVQTVRGSNATIRKPSRERVLFPREFSHPFPSVCWLVFDPDLFLFVSLFLSDSQPGPFRKIPTNDTSSPSLGTKVLGSRCPRTETKGTNEREYHLSLPFPTSIESIEKTKQKKTNEGRRWDRETSNDTRTKPIRSEHRPRSRARALRSKDLSGIGIMRSLYRSGRCKGRGILHAEKNPSLRQCSSKMYVPFFDGPEESVENARLHVVLVNPQIPGNVGSVARTCAASRVPLHLVGPLGFRLDDKRMKRAGLDYWPHVCVAVHDSWDAFYEAWLKQQEKKGTRMIAFTKLSELPHTTKGMYRRGDWLLFGSETEGLPERVHQACAERGERVCIPMVEDRVRSLNLAVSVGIGTYEALRQIQEEGFVVG